MLQFHKNGIKNVFVLEDMLDRISWFTKIFNFCDFLFTTSLVGDALEILNQYKFDVCFLDHDLEARAYEDYFNAREPQEELTGLYIAKKLKDNMNKDTLTIIHSMNPVGSNRMSDVLPNALVIPYDVLVKNTEVIE